VSLCYFSFSCPRSTAQPKHAPPLAFFLGPPPELAQDGLHCFLSHEIGSSGQSLLPLDLAGGLEQHFAVFGPRELRLKSPVVIPVLLS